MGTNLTVSKETESELRLRVDIKPPDLQAFNLQAAAEFLDMLDPDADEFVFKLIDDYKPRKDTVAELPCLHRVGTLEEHEQEMMLRNQEGYGIYVFTQRMKPQSKWASGYPGAKDVQDIRTFLAEKDDGAVSQAYPLFPSMIIESKNGPHLYWLLSDSIPAEMFDYNLMFHRIREALGTDKGAAGSERVLRVPGFYHLKDPLTPHLVTISHIDNERYTLAQIGEAFPAIRPGPKTEKQSETTHVPKGRKYKLYADIKLWIGKPWKKRGDDGDMMRKAIRNCWDNDWTKEQCIEALKQKGGELDKDTTGFINKMYSGHMGPPNLRPETPKQFATGELIDRLRESEIYYDGAQDGLPGYIMVDKKKQSVEFINQNTVTRAGIPLDAVTPIYAEYRPDVTSILFTGTRGSTVNTYSPPVWKKNLFYKGTQVPTAPMPGQYMEFFTAMFPVAESREYVLNWIAYSLKDFNRCILALVGTNQGIGKEALGRIITELHGDSNSIRCKQSIIDKEFNSSLLGKTFAFLDEVSISTGKGYEAMKSMANGKMSAERKGGDSVSRDIFISVLLANNNSESLLGVTAKTDRRFSVPEVTSVRLEHGFFKDNSFGITDYKQLLTPELISLFARYLYNRDLSMYQVNENLRTKHYEAVIHKSRPAWVELVTEDFRSVHYNHAMLARPTVASACKRTKNKPTKIGTIEEGLAECTDVVMIKKLNSIPFIFFSKDGESGENFRARVGKVDRVYGPREENPAGFEFIEFFNQE